MTKVQFDYLSYPAKLHLIMAGAVEIGKKQNLMHHIRLMQFENFYIEVYFNNNKAEMATIRSFTNTAELKYYLEQIDITELFFRFWPFGSFTFSLIILYFLG